MFAVNVLITEVMASNGTTIADGDGQYSDWIEIYNPTAAPINLAGWHLTDDEDELAKWTFPANAQSVLDPGEYLVVFASGQLTNNYIDPAGYLHTNFALSSDGEYLALTNAASTIVSEFSPQFPASRRDVSFGLVDNATTIPLINSSKTAKALVPTNGSLDSANPNVPPAWTLPGFNDASWATSVGGPGVGFDLGDTPPPNIPNGTVLPEGLVGNDYTDPDENGILDGTIFAGGFPGSPANEEPPKGLDNSPDSKWLAFTPAGTYYGFRFSNGTQRVVDSYTITSANDAQERDPYSWTLSGSNDGVNYTVVDARTAQSFGSRYETRLYQFTNTTAYEYYKFDIQTRFGATGQVSTNALQVAEFELLSSAGTDFTPLINLNVAAAYTPAKTSVYQRIKFNVADPAALATLRLEMQYDDGFVAYLNGHRVASAGAPASVNYQSNATTERTDGESLVPSAFNLTPYLSDLVAGENVLSIQVLNRTDASPDLLSRPQLIATQLIDDTKLLRYMTKPTPGTPNVDGYEGIVETPQFSAQRGFYDAAFQLSIANPTPGSQLYYTTNGDAPTPTTGILYTGPISITGTMTVRAQAFRAGYLNSTPATSTYLFVNDIIRQNTQSTLNNGFPGTWGSAAADYGMDRDVIGNFNSAGVPTGGDLYGGVYAATIKNDLKAIPTLSLVMDIDDMFGPSGIYSNPTAGGSAWERPVSAELIYADGTPGFQIDAGIRIQGGAFRSPSLSAKHAMRLLFKGVYEGNTKLDFPLFGEDNATSFDTLTLRMDSNDGYAWDAAGSQAQYARDEFGRRSQEALGQVTPHGNRVHLYINGVYWGIYNPVERPDASFSASYYGGYKEDWDSINSGAIVDGDMTAWNTLLSLSQAVASAGSETARTAAYMKVLGLNADGTDNAGFDTYLDATNYVDYLMVNFFMGNNDWPHRNWWASRMQGPESQGFVFHMWDAETTMGLGSDINTNRLGVSDLVAAPYAALKSSLEFRVLFSDRVHRAFFNNGTLSTQANTARYQGIIDELSQAIVAESARWGDMHSGTPYTKAQWQSAATNVLNYLNSRNNVFLTQLRNAGLYSSVTAPTFNKFGGLVTPGFDLTMSAPAGATWYTLDGSDPREIGGGFSPTAMFYTGSPIDINAGVTVRARTISAGTWSAINEATFTVAAPASGSNLRISEFHYNPAAQPGVADAQTLEFIELFNPSNAPVSLDGVSISQFVTEPYAFPNGMLIEAGQRLVVARNPSILLAAYGSSINVAPTGYAEGNLSNSGERIVLAGPGGVIQDFTFDDAGDWPSAADGGGKSLEIINPFGDPSSGLNWRASYYRGGSPGTSGVAPTVAGDFNADGAADGRDFLAWQRGFGKVALTASAADGDADGDRDVDGADLTLWKANFGAAPVVAAMAASSETSAVSAASELVMAVSAPLDSNANSGDHFAGIAQRAEQLRNSEKESRPNRAFPRERIAYALADGSLRPTTASAWDRRDFRGARSIPALGSSDDVDATDCAFGELVASDLQADVSQDLAAAR
ncbi:lamin tail domain-containing protein [Lacipirellula sp.]|uniref:lamin tail domain-containing protein n=1 Tax=Lacipirellula sp. TaxID=2691419 RepID=UPI003D0F8522